MKIARRKKYIKQSEVVPSEAKYVCRDCGLWGTSSSGLYSHHKSHPDHVIMNTKTNAPIQHRGGKPTSSFMAQARKRSLANGNALDASARDLLLDYVLAKAKEELNSELDRMFRELKSQPTGPARSRTFVAR